MATITVTAAATSFSPPAKVISMSDQTMLDLIASYQSDANVSVNGTATAAQVLNYIVSQWVVSMKNRVMAFNTVPAAVPPPPDIQA